MTTSSGKVGTLLREWRQRKGVSQLDLALSADSSSRHISFIETGRARPSQEMLLRLANELDVPVRDRNALLVAAGFAPQFSEKPLRDPTLAPMWDGISKLLTGYEPYPALVVDGLYNVHATNAGLDLLLDGVASHLLAPPANAMRITLHPEGLAPRILNLAQWRHHLLEQMTRHMALVRSPQLRALYDEVSAYPVNDATPVRAESPYALPMALEHHGQVLSFTSSIATFNTPMDVTVSELAIEMFLPADSETAAYMRTG
ncbi:MAG: helix-turn-helix transcriptional regulator [Corynebacteriales bacterium]|nr:helix-turn-helix transcriptional regulator [Mycobacteriales bacterium]